MNKNINQIHSGIGDNVAGNKTISNGQMLKVNKIPGIPLWLQYSVAIITILAFIWGIYVYFSH